MSLSHDISPPKPTPPHHAFSAPDEHTEHERGETLDVPAQPVFDWWSRAPPAGAAGARRRQGLTASASLGDAGFASFREGVPEEPPAVDLVRQEVETARERGRRIVTSPIDISTTTPARRHRPSTAGSTGLPSLPSGSGLTSPTASNSSPASQFLAVFSPPKSAYDDDGQVVGEYTLGRVIGTGGFSEVRRAVNNNTGAVVAVKAIRKGQAAAGPGPGGEAGTELADRESAIWFGLSHDNILPLFATFDTPYTVYLVMLYCPAGSLLQLVNDKHRPGAGGGLPHAEAGRLFAQIVEGLRYLHLTAKIVHGDMKLENVLIDPEGRCHIADFGLARPIGAPALDLPAHPAQSEERASGAGLVRARTWQARHSSPIPSKRQALAGGKQSFHPGSLEYAAPELLRPSPSSFSSPSDELANPAQDIWALGCILYALLTGRLPFVDSFQPRLQMKIVKGSWEVPQDVGRRAEELLRGCLCMDVGARWDVEMVGESAWVKRWRERSRSPRGRASSRGRALSRERERDGHGPGPEGKKSARSLSAIRTRSLDLRSPAEGEFASSPASLRSARSPSLDRPRARPHIAKSGSGSAESDERVPPLSPPGVLSARWSGERSPSTGTQGPGTPRDGQPAPLSLALPGGAGPGAVHVVGSRSRSRGRRLAAGGLSGLGILEEHRAMVDEPFPQQEEEEEEEEGRGGCEPERRGRRLGRGLGSPGRAARAEVKLEVALGRGEQPRMEVDAVLGAKEEERGRGGGGGKRSSRSASRDRAARDEGRRSKSLGHVLRERSTGREG